MNDDYIVRNVRKFMFSNENTVNLIFELLEMPLDENNLIMLARWNSSWNTTIFNEYVISGLLYGIYALSHATKISNMKCYLNWKHNVFTEAITQYTHVYIVKIPYCAIAYNTFLTKNNIRDFAICVMLPKFRKTYKWRPDEFAKFLNTLPQMHENSPKSFYELMYDYIINHQDPMQMHKWLSTYKPYRGYVRNFPPLIVKICAIYEQNVDAIHNKKRKRWDFAELVFLDDYLVKNVCDMLDISSD